MGRFMKLPCYCSVNCFTGSRDSVKNEYSAFLRALPGPGECTAQDSVYSLDQEVSLDRSSLLV